MSDLAELTGRADLAAGRGKHSRPRPAPAAPETEPGPIRWWSVPRVLPWIRLSMMWGEGAHPWRALGKHRRLVSFGILLGLLGAVAALAQPVVTGELIKAVEQKRSVQGPIMVAAALFIADAVLNALHAYVIGLAGENIVYDLRSSLTSRILRSRFRAYSAWKQGDLFARMVTDTTLARNTMTQAIDNIIINAFLVLGAIALMAYEDVVLLGVTVACLGVTSLAGYTMTRRVRRVSGKNAADMGKFGTALMRVLSAMPTVKASRAEARENQRIAEIARQVRRSGIRVTVMTSMLDPILSVGTQLALTLVIALGAARAANGEMESANLTAFILYLFYLIAPLLELFSSINQFQIGRISLERLAEIDSIELETDRSGGTGKAIDLRKADETAAPEAGQSRRPSPARTQQGTGLTFDNAVFSYPGSEKVILDGVSFTAPERGLTAIVGPSGSGKSTLFQLVERFQDPVKGRICIDGVDIMDMPLNRLRSVVGYVDQDHTLLRGTIRENLTYAAPDAVDKDIAEALRMANLSEVIAALPDGLDTELGDRGAGLSGGQRQRLAIARTLLQAPAYLLLDEATANLDSESEHAMRDSIAMISEFCSVIAIAHRLSTITEAQQIVVMEKGRVNAVGTHAELSSGNDLYQRLVKYQEITRGFLRK